jgi:hypothetical protein
MTLTKSPALGASLNSTTLPPSKKYASPGFWRISLTNIRSVDLTSIFEPFAARMVTKPPPSLSGNFFVTPSNNSSKLSRTSSWPRTHPEKKSL